MIHFLYVLHILIPNFFLNVKNNKTDTQYRKKNQPYKLQILVGEIAVANRIYCQVDTTFQLEHISYITIVSRTANADYVRHCSSTTI
jgi:hypothetical protein